MQENKEEQTKVDEKNWLKDEMEQQSTTTLNGERLPALKMDEGKIYNLKIDFSKKFEQWVDPSNNAVKKLIPCEYNGSKCIFWLNVANPLYRQLLNLGLSGHDFVKILRTGKQKETRYSIVTE